MSSAVRTPLTTGETAGIGSISLARGVVAVAAIGVGAAALVKFDFSGRALVAAFFAAVLVVLAAIDFEKRIIPNRIVVPAGVIVLLGDIAAVPNRAKEWTFAAFAAMLVALVISLATRGGFGMGDVKLAFLLGAGLGAAVVGAFAVAMLATFVVSVGILARRGLKARKEMIPFGPFLALGALIVLFLS
jgi:prepilin signal peptidase PulO-like enzyme (type II secretory pathway)